VCLSRLLNVDGVEMNVLYYYGKVRLMKMTSDMAPVKPTAGLAPVYTRDELLYYRVCDGILSLRRIERQTEASAYRLLVCSSTETSPMLVNIVNSLNVQTLNKPTNQNIGSLHVAIMMTMMMMMMMMMVLTGLLEGT